MSCRPSECVFVRCVYVSPGERVDTRSESEREVCMRRERACDERGETGRTGPSRHFLIQHVTVRV